MIYLLLTLFLIAVVSYLIYLIVYSIRTHVMQQKEKKLDNGIFYKEMEQETADQLPPADV